MAFGIFITMPLGEQRANDDGRPLPGRRTVRSGDKGYYQLVAVATS